MTEQELRDVFDWLQKNMNQQGFFYFKLTDMNQISAYWKINNHLAAAFYINRIMRVLKECDK